jgi:putative DNA primase/helicase
MTTTPRRISYYKSATTVQAADREITMKELADEIASERHRATVEKIRTAQTETDVTRFKKSLPIITTSAEVTGSKLRKAADVENRFIHSGFLQIDIDGGGLNGATPAEAKKKLEADPHAAAAFFSPSGAGAKAFFRIPPCSNKEDHKAAWHTVRDYVLETTGLEMCPGTTGLMHPCFLSWDPTCRYNPKAKEFSAANSQARTHAPPPTHKPEHTHRGKKQHKAFPSPPAHGIHAWLPKAAWHCRLTDRLDAAGATAKIKSFETQCRRAFSPHEVEDAVAFVYAAPPPGMAQFETPLPDRSLDLAMPSLTDLGNAERVYSREAPNVRWIPELGNWIVWNGTHWAPDTNGEMIRRFVKIMKRTGRAAFDLPDAATAAALKKYAGRSLNAVPVENGLKMLKSLAGVTLPIRSLDQSPFILGTPAGTIDLLAGSPLTPDRSLYITRQAGTDYDPSAECPTWLRFLSVVTNDDEELIEYLQKCIGYSLTANIQEQCLFFLYGTGSNGKSVFVRTLKKLAGDYGQAAPEALFAKGKNEAAPTAEIARLNNARVVVASEIEEGTLLAESRIKHLTGDDFVTGRFLFQKSFDFLPTCKFWIVGNYRPTIKGADDGIWRRIRLIPFTAKISDEQKDPKLGKKLEAELPGILRWALAGLKAWQEKGLGMPACVQTATNAYRAAEDVVGEFLAELTDDVPGAMSLQKTLFDKYAAWAHALGMHQTMTARTLNRKLEERGYLKTRTREGRFWLGLEIKPD